MPQAAERAQKKKKGEKEKKAIGLQIVSYTMYIHTAHETIGV